MIDKIIRQIKATASGFIPEDYFDEGYKDGLYKAIEIVQEVAKEYGNASDNDLEVVSALPSLYPLQPFEEEAIHKVVASAKDCGWIPVEEKNPTLFESVYVTCISLVDERPSWVIEGIYGTEGWHGMSYMLRWGEAKVIAWMPKELPAPYQKGENQNGV